MRLAYCPYMLKFRNPAGTSRGVMTEKPTYLLKIWDEANPEIFGLGEASVFPGLSLEADGRYEYKVVELLANIALGRATDLGAYPSLKFGLEQAINDFSNGGRGIYFPSSFTEGTATLRINGLVWMGTASEMKERVREKLDAGFRCIKLKVGAISWEEELEMVRSLRNEFSPVDLEIRLDANGGFPEQEALQRLRELEPLAIHSIEQPVKPGNPDLMAMLCRESPIPIALDESLIGLHSSGAKNMLLDYIAPQFIILKPTLCGGFSGAEEWIALAQKRGIGWWVTSALESNIGLNALAQWTATLGNPMPQGLGTGQLFVNNLPSPLSLEGETISFDRNFRRNPEIINSLDWRS
ncbi:MAG: o-succinylbenzoate synthase [Bacteroides sp.]|nr:o-succinylbenzoate synthase [Bacteroides sp.]